MLERSDACRRLPGARVRTRGGSRPAARFSTVKDASWLTDVFRTADVLTGDERVIRACPASGRTGVAMTSVAERLDLDYSRADAGPPSVFVKRALTRGRDWSDHYDRERRFYRELFDRVPVRVPRCLAISAAGDPYYIVQEDVVAVGAEHALFGFSEERGRRVIDDLVRLHTTFWDGAGVADWPVNEWTEARAARLRSKIVRRRSTRSLGRDRWPTTPESREALAFLRDHLVGWSAFVDPRCADAGPRRRARREPHVHRRRTGVAGLADGDDRASRQ